MSHNEEDDLDYDDDFDYDDEDWGCTWCGGEGWMFGDDMGDPLRYLPDEVVRCPACGGSGRAKDQTMW